MAGEDNATGPNKAAKAILDLLGRREGRPVSQRELSRQIKLSKEDRKGLPRLIQKLIKSGRVARVSGGKLTLGSKSGGGIRGEFRRRGQGAGFVAAEDGGAPILIPRRGLNGARDGDTVLVRVQGRGRADRRNGTVLEVLRRRDASVVGIFRLRDGEGVVHPFDPARPRVRVPAELQLDAGDGDAVTVEVLPDSSDRYPEGEILEVLGNPKAPGVDTEIVIRKHGLAVDFSPAALAESKKLPEAVPADEARRRTRFDNPPTVTIDGETAKDFDDAIAVEKLPNGNFRLYVHIADVAHFVLPGTALDDDALARGTSVYFPGRVLPMLPEKISNHLCSLRPHEDRLVQSAIMEIDDRGNLVKARFTDGVIRSRARLTYTQVAELFDAQKDADQKGAGKKGQKSGSKAGRGGGRRKPRTIPGIDEDIAAMLALANELRQVLEAKRRRRGSVDFDLPEPQILLDVEGVMTGIVVEPRNEAHRLIEEFMLAANEAVARQFRRRKLRCMYRVHEEPDPLKVEALAAFAEGFGLALKRGGQDDGVRPRDIQALLDAADGRPEQPLVAQVALRSMKQARYHIENLGHFGLAAPTYCHFTSPIRRYPDLIVHRLLRASRVRGAFEAMPDEKRLERMSVDCSKLEREAEAAERELLAWKKIAFVRDRVGDIMPGVVSAVTNFGLFVQLQESLVEGLLRFDGLDDDHYEFNERRLELRGQRRGRVFRLGQKLEVRLDRVDERLRRVDFSLPEAPPPSERRSSRPPSRGAGEGRPRKKSNYRRGRPARRRR